MEYRASSGREAKMRIDKTDLRILGELQSDARISVAELAKRVALTPTPCARRLQQLEQSGVIKAYVAVLDQAALGLPVDAFVEVRLTREGKDEVAEFESKVHSYPEVMQCWMLSGGSDYLLRVVAADLEGYNRFLRDELMSLACVDHVQTGFALQRVVDRTALPLRHLGQGSPPPRKARQLMQRGLKRGQTYFP
ncbi:MAG TPA: Lrp/AsnC family transcriptional regulator, partial [Rhodanobacteraceae bacterium]|nr:Lrp/AsnC family transcriptional regulator [Rhodanobacteraceae bacterium]